MSITKLMTAEELELLPGDGHRYELVRGEVVRISPVIFEHLEVTNLIAYYLTAWALPGDRGTVGGEGGFVLEREPDTVRAPDVVFVRADRVPHGEARRHFVNLAPDLAVEVRSPSESLRDLVAKAEEYLAAGTRLVWIFDPRSRRVHVRTETGKSTTLGIDDVLDGGDVLPGFTLPIRQVFRSR
jgi:Uma2 family endonuclease